MIVLSDVEDADMDEDEAETANWGPGAHASHDRGLDSVDSVVGHMHWLLAPVAIECARLRVENYPE